MNGIRNSKILNTACSISALRLPTFSIQSSILVHSVFEKFKNGAQCYYPPSSIICSYENKNS